jgi:hypothetical protein
MPTPTADEFFKMILAQLVHDECDHCHKSFWWGIGLSTALCANCLFTNYRDYERVQQLQAQTRKELS